MDVRRPETIGAAATAGRCYSGRGPRGCWPDGDEATAAMGAAAALPARVGTNQRGAALARRHRGLGSQPIHEHHKRRTFVGRQASKKMK